MYKITLTCEAHPSLVVNDDDYRELNSQQLRRLDGIDCQDNFSEYFHEQFTIGNKIYKNEQSLINKGVSGGYMRFKFLENSLKTIVEYDSREELNNSELEELISYTNGQLSDGIGEGYEQRPCYSDDEGEYFISPGYVFSDNVTQQLV